METHAQRMKKNRIMEVVSAKNEDEQKKTGSNGFSFDSEFLGCV